MRRACTKVRPCLYVRAREIGLMIREGYHSPEAGDSELAVIRRLASPWLLVIDEIQERPDTDFEKRCLTLLVDMRYGDRKPTILIGNVEPDNLADILPDSIIDRTNEDGGCLHLNWGSFRSKA